MNVDWGYGSGVAPGYGSENYKNYVKKKQNYQKVKTYQNYVKKQSLEIVQIYIQTYFRIGKEDLKQKTKNSQWQQKQQSQQAQSMGINNQDFHPLKLPWRKAPGCFIAIKDIY